jgi:hypothetical protein
MIITFGSQVIGGQDNVGGGAQPTALLYPSTDRALRYGSGTKDYETFGDQDIDSNNRCYFVFRKGSDHNSTGDGDIVLIASDDAWVTISAVVTIHSAVANLNSTNPNVSVLDNDRIMISWTDIPFGASLGNPTRVKSVYSDDLSSVSIASIATATYSSIYTWPQFSAKNYTDGPGKAIHLGAGVALKPIWANDPVQVNLCYRTTDNGASWAYYSTVSADAVDPCDETCFGIMLDGTIVAAQRCNNLHKLRISLSTDNGATWGALATTSIDCYGKPACPRMATADDNLPIMCRDWFGISNRTKLVQTKDGVSFTEQYMDHREIYMYGGIVDHPTVGLIALYNVEAQNSPLNQGPTLLIYKQIAESTTPVSPPFAYDVNYQSVIDFNTVDGVTQPSDATKLIDNTFVAGVRSDGWITEFDSLYLPMANNPSLELFYRRSFIQAWLSLTPVDSPTYDANGYDFNGTTEYLVLATALSNLAKFLQNSASVIYYTADNVQGNPAFGVGNGAFSTRTDGTFLNPRNNSNLLFYSVNGGALQSVANASATGLYIIKRLNSTSIEVWKDPDGSGMVNIASNTVTSTGRATFPLHVGAERFSDGVFLFSTKGCGCIGLGSAMDGSEAAISARFFTRKTALGL